MLAEQSANPAKASSDVKLLQAWTTRVDWNKVLPGFARCVRIVRDQKKTFEIDPQKFVELAEKNLYQVLSQRDPNISIIN